MKRAVERVIAGEKIRKVALMESVNRQTLCKYVSLYKRAQSAQQEAVFKGNLRTRVVFTLEDEAELTEYILQCSRICYGLTPSDIRSLAYNLTIKNGKTFPDF